MGDQDHPLTIGDVSARSGVAPSALRYYEAQRLIFSSRTTGNQRRYERSTLRRVAFIRAAQRVGLSLEEITAALATLPGGRTPSRSDWARLSQNWRPRIDEQIDRLQRLRDRLDGCIGCGCLSLDTCSLQNPEDRMAARGPGAGPPRTGWRLTPPDDRGVPSRLAGEPAAPQSRQGGPALG